MMAHAVASPARPLVFLHTRVDGSTERIVARQTILIGDEPLISVQIIRSLVDGTGRYTILICQPVTTREEARRTLTEAEILRTVVDAGFVLDVTRDCMFGRQPNPATRTDSD